ncbi:RNA polymerase I specific transcription initiation factor RRN3 protein [Artemisia annua]|uniref:RNA polymerase I specific transcription initiation factor RRN3 protein n=1 Tax=Artemisia annua TaxID=35608 RepID=A0A2U1L6F0_ARTAN|nr:RNA polymerase I specific transcription initiation factor RRN3 protein [Artemisia annua]
MSSRIDNGFGIRIRIHNNGHEVEDGDTDGYDQLIGNMHKNVRLVPDEVAMLVICGMGLWNFGPDVMDALVELVVSSQLHPTYNFLEILKQPRGLEQIVRERVPNVFANEAISYEGSGEAKTNTGAVKEGDGKNDQMQPYLPEEINPFTESVHNAKLPKKTRMPDNVQPYDRSEDPVDHVQVFHTAARVYK